MTTTKDRLSIIGYSDGACKGNPGKGGWGFVLSYYRDATLIRWMGYGGDMGTTNNKMELTGIIKALNASPVGHDITIRADTSYGLSGIVKDGTGVLSFDRDLSPKFTGWINGWKKNGWKTKGNQPVKNQELWTNIIDECDRHLKGGSTLKFEWVKGHATDEGNILADELANRGVPS
jgi:ribonuclease HI